MNFNDRRALDLLPARIATLQARITEACRSVTSWLPGGRAPSKALR